MMWTPSGLRRHARPSIRRHAFATATYRRTERRSNEPPDELSRRCSVHRCHELGRVGIHALGYWTDIGAEIDNYDHTSVFQARTDADASQLAF